MYVYMYVYALHRIALMRDWRRPFFNISHATKLHKISSPLPPLSYYEAKYLKWAFFYYLSLLELIDSLLEFCSRSSVIVCGRKSSKTQITWGKVRNSYNGWGKKDKRDYLLDQR